MLLFRSLGLINVYSGSATNLTFSQRQNRPHRCLHTRFPGGKCVNVTENEHLCPSIENCIICNDPQKCDTVCVCLCLGSGMKTFRLGRRALLGERRWESAQSRRSAGAKGKRE